jgi:hypothetical protein
MSGPGDIEGEVSGDEAAWRDLVARFERTDDPAVAEAPWPAREDLPSETPEGEADGDLIADPDLPEAAGPGPLGLGPLAPGGLPPFDRARVIRPASDQGATAGPRSYTPSEETDEPYVPVPLPPPAKLDPLAKAAWVGVVGGPAYLLVASLIMHWTISAAEAFVAVAAFIGGFATLVIKLGDHPRDDDDNGAVL